MQMVDYAKPAEADSSKKKYGSFLAHFEKQLWVDNSKQSSEHCSCRRKSTSLLGSLIKYVLIWENTAKRPGKERKSTGKKVSGFALLSQTRIAMFSFLSTVSEYNMIITAGVTHGCLQKSQQGDVGNNKSSFCCSWHNWFPMSKWFG